MAYVFNPFTGTLDYTNKPEQVQAPVGSIDGGNANTTPNGLFKVDFGKAT